MESQFWGWKIGEWKAIIMYPMLVNGKLIWVQSQTFMLNIGEWKANIGGGKLEIGIQY